jgi:hypothetical protein
VIPARPLDRFPVIRTRNIDEMRAALARIYAKPVLIPEGHVRTIAAAANSRPLRHIVPCYGKYGAAMRAQFSESNFCIQIFPIAGKGEVAIGQASASVNPENCAVISSGTGFKANYSADYEQVVLMLHSTSLTNMLSTLTGASIGGALRFDLASSIARPAVRILRDHFLLLVNGLSSAAAPLPSLVLAEFEQTLMTMFLHVNRHNYSHLLELEPPDAALSQVRRAEEYIEANWDQPISLETVTSVTGVSARSLFRSFKQSRGCSPLEFAIRIRQGKNGKH